MYNTWIEMVSISHIGMEPEIWRFLSSPFLVSISHIGMEQKRRNTMKELFKNSINLSYRYGTQNYWLSSCDKPRNRWVSISHIGMEPKGFTVGGLSYDDVSISHIGMEQQHLVAKKHYNTYILICQ